jgi:hypothetical protein
MDSSPLPALAVALTVIVHIPLGVHGAAVMVSVEVARQLPS